MNSRAKLQSEAEIAGVCTTFQAGMAALAGRVALVPAMEVWVGAEGGERDVNRNCSRKNSPIKARSRTPATLQHHQLKIVS